MGVRPRLMIGFMPRVRMRIEARVNIRVRVRLRVRIGRVSYP